MALEASGTVIGRSATFRGELSGQGDVRIDGVLDGSVQVEGGRITVGPDATVRAQLTAQEIVIYGQVDGELRATVRVELRSTARVIGDVFAARLAIEDDATLRGHVDILDPAGSNEEQPSVPPIPKAGSEVIPSTAPTSKNP